MPVSAVSLINLLIFAALLVLLVRLAHSGVGLSRRVLSGLVLGSVFGFYLQFGFGSGSAVAASTLQWTNVVAGIYVNLLRLIIMPLVLVTMIAAVLRVQEFRTIGKIGGSVVAVLLTTTMIAALTGILLASVFGLNAADLTSGVQEMETAQTLPAKTEQVAALSIPALLVSFVPSNIFVDLAEGRSTSIIAVVMFGLLFGIAALMASHDDSIHGKRIQDFVDTLQAVIMKLVKLVISMTPYGVLALMTRIISGSDGQAILTLISFVLASYLAILLMFGVHAVLLRIAGAPLRDYIHKVWPVLAFAFATRSSAASIPLSIKTQIDELQVPAPIANIAASFGATIGQNGCAGIYPAMLAVMVATATGVEIDAGFVVSLVLIVAVGSFGIAGVGGGATNAALVVLPAMGLPVTVVALLISIEPLIDMGRTALNVNGAITAGMLTRRWLRPKTEKHGPVEPAV